MKSNKEHSMCSEKHSDSPDSRSASMPERVAYVTTGTGATVKSTKGRRELPGCNPMGRDYKASISSRMPGSLKGSFRSHSYSIRAIPISA